MRGEDRALRTEAIVARMLASTSAATHSDELVGLLIETNMPVATSMASRYRNRGVDIEDLEQVALLGLTKAAQRFDPTAGHDFLSYAAPTIRGELKRYFRDKGWMVRPPRGVQELQARIRGAQEELEARLGRSPRPSEIAAHLEEDLEQVVEGLTADGCFTPTSLDGPVGSGSTFGEMLGYDDPGLAESEVRALLAPVMARLSERDRTIVQMRFMDERSQKEIGDHVGLTQAHVSRLLTQILSDMRAELDEAPVARRS